MVIAVIPNTPTVENLSLVAKYQTATPVTLVAYDYSAAATFTYTIVTPPAHGTLSGTAPNLTYTPDAGFVGLDAFTFTASDGKDTSAAATAMITVTGSTSKATVKVAKVAKTRLVCRTRSGKRVCVRR